MINVSVMRDDFLYDWWPENRFQLRLRGRFPWRFGLGTGFSWGLSPSDDYFLSFYFSWWWRRITTPEDEFFPLTRNRTKTASPRGRNITLTDDDLFLFDAATLAAGDLPQATQVFIDLSAAVDSILAAA